MTLYGAEASCWNYFGWYRADTWCASFQSSSQITALSWKPAMVNKADWNNGVPQGSVLSPLLFNVYIADLPQTNSKKYGYADNIALLKVHRDWNTIEEKLSQDMSILSTWLKQWRLKLSEAKTVSATFQLNNREVKRELNVNISGRRLTCQRTPTYLGVKLDRTLKYRDHLTALRGKVMARSA